MNKNLALVVLLILVSTISLLLVSQITSSVGVPSPLLIAATIIALVAMYGTILSLYLRTKTTAQI